MRAHLVQYDIVWENKAASHACVLATLDGVAIDRGDLVVLPEMFDTGFSVDTDSTGLDPEFSIGFLTDLARDRGVYTLGGITAPGLDGRSRNRAVVVSPAGAVIATYDKVHPFSFGRESERFAGGESVEQFEWEAEAESIRCGLAICYDLRFPELFRLGVDGGAAMFVVIANWPASRREHWRALLIARAIENQAFVLGVNRTGSDPHLAYAGGSIAVDPRGRVLGEAGSGQGALSVEVSPALALEWRERFPALRDRRYSVNDRVSGGIPGLQERSC